MKRKTFESKTLRNTQAKLNIYTQAIILIGWEIVAMQIFGNERTWENEKEKYIKSTFKHMHLY